MGDEMNLYIDPLKLLDQDDDFKAYASAVALEFIKTSPDMIKAIYGFYDIDLSVGQVARWLKTNQNLNNQDNE
jgi:hypothetical protein